MPAKTMSAPTPVRTDEKTDTNKYRCGVCKGYHASIADVKGCTDKRTNAKAPKLIAKKVEPIVKRGPVRKPTTVIELATILARLERPADDDEAIAKALGVGIIQGEYDAVLDDLDEILSKRLDALGYTYVDTNAPARNEHAKKLGKAPSTPSAPKPRAKKGEPFALTSGHMNTDFAPWTNWKPEDGVIRNTICKIVTTKTRSKYEGHFFQVHRDNRDTYGGVFMSGPMAGRTGRVSKSALVPMRLITAETADLRTDVKKGAKVNVKEELAEARRNLAAAAETTDTVTDDDDNPAAVRRVRKIKKDAAPKGNRPAPKEAIAEAEAALATAPRKRRRLMRG